MQIFKTKGNSQCGGRCRNLFTHGCWECKLIKPFMRHFFIMSHYTLKYVYSLLISPNVKHKPIKFLEENIRENLCDFVLGNEFLDTTLQAFSIKEKIDRLYFTHIKNILSMKDTIKRIKKSNHRPGENIYRSHI